VESVDELPLLDDVPASDAVGFEASGVDDDLDFPA
jgi:hypothetical protein